MNASLNERLALENADLFAECVDGAFVSALADGSLPPAAFRAYLGQDVLFVRDFLAATAMAVKACADDPGLVRGFADLLVGAVAELATIERDAVAFGVDLNRLERMPTTVAFAKFLAATATSGRPDMCVAAFSPCLELYSYIGRKAEEQQRVSASVPAYRAWFAKYASQGMQDLAQSWRRHLDEFGSYTTEARQAYRAALGHERDFFLTFHR